MAENKGDPMVMEIMVRVVRLEQDVKWIKKLLTPNMFISGATFVALIMLVIRT